MSVGGKIVTSFSSTAGSFFLVSVTAGLGLALYVATTPDSVSAPAQAQVKAVADPPLVRAEPVTPPSSAPNIVEVATMALTKPIAPPVPSSDRAARVRQLQKALARAQCYNGPISGIWSDASKDAMRGFAATVNAQLPVDSPDDALVALVESNETATCARGRAIATGALGAGVQPVSLQQTREEIRTPAAPAPSAVTPPPSVEERTMLDQPWARAEMLTMPKEEVAAVTPPPSERPAPMPAVAATANERTPVNTAKTSSVPTIYFEDNKAVAVDPPADPDSAAAVADPGAPPVTPPKPKKKTAKRKPGTDDDIQTSISKGFDNFQRSLSSMF
ncbi:MAG: hypothetical protein JSS54_00845 [Proteobacteria bacterium]|nr:hypothetical protein [Pseudomonadota bacterium]